MRVLPSIVTALFFLVVLSYYILLFLRKKQHSLVESFSSVSVIIPARNEEDHIVDSVESVLAADFKGRKEVIVVDDASIDRTYSLLKKYGDNITLLHNKKQVGKAASLNRGLALATGTLIAVVDGDSIIHKTALSELSKVLTPDTAAATGVIKVRNRKRFICMWLHLEQVYNSLMRSLFSKINANIVTPGPLSMYKRQVLVEIGGFSTTGFSEDVDITIRLIRRGYRIGYCETAVAETNMPFKVREFFRQRMRTIRGTLNIFRKHLRLNTAVIDLYTLPLWLFTYVQAVIMGVFTLSEIISGYITYFYSKGIYVNGEVLKFFLEWLSLVGFARWAIGIFTGETLLTTMTVFGVLSTLLVYPLYLFAVLRFDKKIDLFHVIPLFFMFPFWLVIMALHLVCLPEYFRTDQKNVWKKNER